jgi:protein involved in polysaccharide export with SLBB domain
MAGRDVSPLLSAGRCRHQPSARESADKSARRAGCDRRGRSRRRRRFVAAAPEAFAQGQAYKLGAGDKIRVVVLSDTDLSSDYEVDATGSISARMLGRLSVIGLTMAELETLLSERYRSSGYLRDPKLSVELLSARPFFILGEIIKPGSYPYTSGLTRRWRSPAAIRGVPRRVESR